jgi:hypothetical protein
VAVDLSTLSDSDLQALQAGDLTKLSDEGLAHLHTEVNVKPAAAPAAAVPKVALPKAPDRSWGDVAGDAAVNAIPSTVKMAGGIVHAVAHPIDTFNGLADVLEGATRKLAENNAPTKAYVDFMDNLFGTQPEAKARTIALANQVGGVYKQRYGTEAGFKKSLAEDPAGVFADLSMLLGGAGGVLRTGAKVAGAGDTAAMLGKVADVADTAATVTNPMTYAMKATGAVAAPVARGISAVATPLLMGAKNNFLLNAVGKRGEEITNALRDTGRILVPGTQPTAGEVAAGVGETKFSAAQKAAESVLPTEYFDRSALNRAAHQAALEKVSGTPAQQADALAVRAGNADELYTKAKAQVVPTDTALNDILKRPAVQSALSTAEDIARNEGAGFNIRPRPTAEITGRDTLTNAPVEPPKYSIGDLHYVKIALDKMLKPGQTGVSAAEQSALGNARTALVKWMNTKSPDYSAARATYERQSVPINQQEVGQVLKDALENPVLPSERRGVFATAMDNAASTIKKATGQSRFQKLDEVLSPAQIKIVNGVRADVERQALMEAQAKAASSAAPNINTASGDMLAQATGGAAVPGMLSRVTMAANAIMKRLEGRIDKKLAIELAADMLDPAKTAKAIDTAMARQKQLAGRGEAIRREGKIVGNALASQRGVVAAQVDNALTPQ